MTAGYSYELVTDLPTLRSLCERWLTEPAIALDTEFVRERTYYPKLGLVQVADRESIALLDTVVLEDLEPLAKVLSSRSVIKVIHACGEDVQVFHSAMGLVPENVFDTQLGAGLCGLGYPRSYSALVAALLDVQLDKGQTRSDWLRRPLQPRQLDYAADDVAYLLPISRELHRRAEPSGRVSWISEESARVADPRRFLTPPELMFQRIKGRGRLHRSAHRRLRDLAAWREREARRRDLPRGFVFSDKELLEIARNPPLERADLKRISWLGGRRRHRYGRKLIEIASTQPNTSEPFEVDLRRFEKPMKRLRQQLITRATELGISPELLASKRHVTEVFAAFMSSPEHSANSAWRGWRNTAAGDLVADTLGNLE